MNDSEQSHSASAPASPGLRMTATIWAVTLAILLGGSIVAASLGVKDGASGVIAGTGVVVAHRTVADPASPGNRSSGTSAATAR